MGTPAFYNEPIIGERANINGSKLSVLAIQGPDPQLPDQKHQKKKHESVPSSKTNLEKNIISLN